MKVALFIFIASATFLICGLTCIGVFSRYKYLTKVESTSGPDFYVILGDSKLRSQMPDTIARQDCGGIMVTTNDLQEIYKFQNEETSSLEWDNYYVLTGKVVGVKRSDGDLFHPLVDVTSSFHIDKFLFWILTITNVAILIASGLYYRRRAFRSESSN